MMTGLKISFACCLCLALASAFPTTSCYGEQCESDESDEAQLLQASKTQASVNFPDLGDVLKKASGALTKVGDVAEIGVKTIAATVDGVLSDVNGQLGKIEAFCNASFKAFDMAASVNGTVSDNITKFERLVNDTIGNFLKLFASFKDNLTEAVDTASSTLELAGQGDLAEKLNTSMSAAVSQLSSLADVGQAVVSKAVETSAEKASEQIPNVKTAIQNLVGATGEFATKLIDSFREASDQLLKFVKSKVPKESQEALGKPLAEMLEKARFTAERLKKTVALTSEGLDRSADTVAMSAQSLSSRGFFGKLEDFFVHLFR
eukprot:TRINITY_DN57445_c0_g1_i1.p1 TRINITY_DN57445_c0_g1~~TRINITY_DN57445_c0_g1_i1.p1  ORF type:complete len:319 (-),score=75.56 TRINITY_DN57445_c0_g1_i1:548-1504(-)